MKTKSELCDSLHPQSMLKTTLLSTTSVITAIYCIDVVGNLEYNDIFSGKYDDIFLLHTGLYTGQVLSKLTKDDKVVINDFIDETNFLFGYNGSMSFKSIKKFLSISGGDIDSFYNNK